MDELEISGKRYISTRRAAREHGYHSDYMGQLIRGKKVVGQKVGRAWYIEEDSLATYLGKVPATPAPKAAPVVEAQAPVAVERLVVEEPVAPAPAPEPMPEPVAPVVQEVVPQPTPVVVEHAQSTHVEAQPVVHAQYVAPEPTAVQQPVHTPAPTVREIHHAPYLHEEERRVPIHTPAPTPAPVHNEPVGLRYAADDSPVMPVVTRMPQQAYAPVPTYAAAPRQSSSTFPYISLSVVGILAILASLFASNFVTVSVVSEQGKAATVQYAIHW